MRNEVIMSMTTWIVVLAVFPIGYISSLIFYKIILKPDLSNEEQLNSDPFDITTLTGIILGWISLGILIIFLFGHYTKKLILGKAE